MIASLLQKYASPFCVLCLEWNQNVMFCWKTNSLSLYEPIVLVNALVFLTRKVRNAVVIDSAAKTRKFQNWRQKNYDWSISNFKIGAKREKSFWASGSPYCRLLPGTVLRTTMGVWAYFFNLFSIENPPPPMSVTCVVHIYDTCRDVMDLRKSAHTPIVVRNTVPGSNLQYGLLLSHDPRF